MRFKEPSRPVNVHLVESSCQLLVVQAEGDRRTVQNLGRIEEVDAECKVGWLKDSPDISFHLERPNPPLRQHTLSS